MTQIIMTADQNGLYFPKNRPQDVADTLTELLLAQGSNSPINIQVTNGNPSSKFWAENSTTEGITIFFRWSKHLFLFGQKWRAHMKTMGAALSKLIALLASLAPRRQIVMTADHGGAGVALAALKSAPRNCVSKLFLFRAKEFSAYALWAAKSAAGRETRIYNFTQNKYPLLTRLAEAFSAKPGKLDHFLHTGLAFKLPNWTDIAESPADLSTWLEDLGFGQALQGFAPLPKQKSSPIPVQPEHRDVA